MKKILYYLTARTQAGIRVRLWMAVLMSVTALLVNVFYIKEEFDRLPQVVPVLFDMYGEIVGWGHRSLISDYAEIRTIFFLVMLLTGWVIYKAKGCTLMGQRLGLLVVDIANLVITTVVGMSLVYIEIANGDTTEKLSEHWEYAVMLFWMLTLIVEYFADKKHIRN